MTTTKFDNLWLLMSKNTFQVYSDTIHEDLKCVICKKIKSECGCQYCYKCIKKYLNAGNKYCPGMKDECKDEYLALDGNVFRNAVLNKKVSKVKVHCPNESCQSVEELIKMEDHLLFCMKNVVECPYAYLGCDYECNYKDKMISHLNEDIFKHNHLLIDHIQNMKNELSNLKENSNDTDNMKMEIVSLKNELEITKIEIISLKEESIIKENKVRGDFENSNVERASLKKDATVKDIQINEMRKEIELMKLEFNKIQVPKNKESDDVRIDISEIRERESGDVTKLIFGENYDFVWTIKGFTAKSKSINSFFSDPFYKNYYKLYTHHLFMYIYAYILRGENDDKAVWPLKHSFTVSVINQWTLQRSDFTEESFPSRDKCSYERPTTDKNSGIYLGYICPHDIRQTPGIIYNDSVAIGFTLH